MSIKKHWLTLMWGLCVNGGSPQYTNQITKSALQQGNNLMISMEEETHHIWLGRQVRLWSASRSSSLPFRYTLAQWVAFSCFARLPSKIYWKYTVKIYWKYTVKFNRWERKFRLSYDCSNSIQFYKSLIWVNLKYPWAQSEFGNHHVLCGCGK